MTKSAMIAMCVITLSSTANAAELRDVIVHPQKYERQHVQVIGIARTSDGWFYLFPDAAAAAKNDWSTGRLFVRQEGRAKLGQYRVAGNRPKFCSERCLSIVKMRAHRKRERAKRKES